MTTDNHSVSSGGDNDVAEMRALHAAAGPGEALAGELLCLPNDEHWPELVRGWFKAGRCDRPAPAETVALFKTREDADLWAMAVNELPKIAAEIEALRTANEQLHGRIETMCSIVYAARRARETLATAIDADDQVIS